MPAPQDTYPGAILPDESLRVSSNGGHQIGQPSTRSGPEINGEQTTISLYTVEQLAASRFLPSFKKVANEAFREGHTRYGLLPADVDRIRDVHEVVEELRRSGPSTFTYIVHSNDTDVIGTATMRRMLAESSIDIVVGASPEETDRAKRVEVFNRHEPMAEGTENWELKLMVVDQRAQGHGLASMLIKLCEEEVKGRVLQRQDSTIEAVRFILTCIGEINGKFYRKRGFTLDYDVWQPKGMMGSETGFRISHMSKCIDTGN